MLIEAITAASWIGGAYAATNLDNLALLVHWLLQGSRRPLPILSGHLLGMLVLLVLSYAFGTSAGMLPVRFIGLLGIVPISLGLRGLYQLWQDRPRHDRAEQDQASSSVDPQLSASRFLPLTLAATQVANGVDTVLVFGPLLADSESRIDFVLIAGFTVMSFVWFGLALLLRTHLTRLKWLERYGHWVGPIVLILAGLYILDNTATDVLSGD